MNFFSQLFRRSINIALFLTAVCGFSRDSRSISVNPANSQKDLSNSYMGANAQQFRSHYSIRKMLDNQKKFSDFLLSIGSPVLRMDGRSIYGWFSTEECLKLREANIKMSRLNKWRSTGKIASKKYQPEDYEAVVKKYRLSASPVAVKSNHPDIAWFDPDLFHRFCRENKIRIIGAISDEQYYDNASGKVVYFRDRPEYFDGAVKSSMKKIAWVLNHGYKDLYVAWEIGNESFASWDPVLYAKYAKKIADAALKLQPDIKLSVPAIIRDTDDPFIKSFIKRLKAKGSTANWFDWHKKMIPAIGDSIAKITHVTAHVYGAKSKYNANAKGLALATDLSDIPNTGHLRFLVTEWRYTGVGGTDHRTYVMGALWNAKFAMLLLSHPKIDYSTVHEFLCTSGLGYWTPGKSNGDPGMVGDEWIYQYQPGKKKSKQSQLRDPVGKPCFDIGPFGPVNRMFNELIRDCPVLLEHESDLGKMSSAKFADGVDISKHVKKNGDIDWIICVSKDRSSLGGIIVNTLNHPVTVTLNFKNSKYELKNIAQMTCRPERIFTAEEPGQRKFWKVLHFPVKNNSLALPPDSITSFRGSFFSGKK